MNNTTVLTFDGKPLNSATKDWLDLLADVIRRRCGDRPVMKMYAYRHCTVEYLAMDFDPTTPAPRGKVNGGFSITMSVHGADSQRLELPTERVFEVVLSMKNWVDALTIANLLCRSLGSAVEFNPV